VGARQKLNDFYFLASVLIAGLAGVCSQSWLLFVMTLVALIVASVYSGDIRPEGRHR
jgi:4-hydroxybenzoate polyprenyltransferase